MVGQHDPRHRPGLERLQERTWELRAEPSDSGGSRITVVNDRVPKGKGLLFAPMMLLSGKRMLAGHLRKTLALLEEAPKQSPSS